MTIRGPRIVIRNHTPAITEAKISMLLVATLTTIIILTLGQGHKIFMFKIVTVMFTKKYAASA